jgi:REP element-mobilizing transposase RayT
MRASMPEAFGLSWEYPKQRKQSKIRKYLLHVTLLRSKPLEKKPHQAQNRKTAKVNDSFTLKFTHKFIHRFLRNNVLA